VKGFSRGTSSETLYEKAMQNPKGSVVFEWVEDCLLAGIR
jgi:hypothetical protein